MPLSHVGGLMILARSAAAASTVVLEPFDAERAAKRLQEGDITLASLVRPCSRASSTPVGRPGPRLRRIMLGGGPVAPALLRRAADAWLPRLPDLTGSPRPARRSRSPSPVTSRPPPRAPRHRSDSGAGRRDLISGPTVRGGVRTRCAPATSAGSTTRAA